MQARKDSAPSISSPGMATPATRRAPQRSRGSCAAILLAAGLLLTGCGGNRPGMSTAPQTDAGVDTVNTLSALPAAAELAGSTTLGAPLRGLNAAELARFTAGKAEFEDLETVAGEGLGPVFNEASCTTCHTAPTGGTSGRTETRFGRSVAGG